MSTVIVTSAMAGNLLVDLVTTVVVVREVTKVCVNVVRIVDHKFEICKSFKKGCTAVKVVALRCRDRIITKRNKKTRRGT